MTTGWGFADFDDHEGVHLFTDPASGLRAVIAIHSTKLGPAAGGVRFWHYADSDRAITDALRLSRGMSFKNAMAGLADGRRQGRYAGGEPRRCDYAGAARSIRPRGRIARRALCDGRGCRHVRSEHEDHRHDDAPRVRPARCGGQCRRRSRAVDCDGRLSRRQGGGAARAWRDRHEGRTCRDPGRRQRGRRFGALAREGWRALDAGRCQRRARHGAGRRTWCGDRCRRCDPRRSRPMWSAPTRSVRS